MEKKTVCIAVILMLGFVCTPLISISQSKAVTSSLVLSTNNNTLFVGGEGPGNYSKIQDAIDNASEGDTVYVFEGVYHEAVNISKRIILTGEKKETTIIDAQEKGYCIYLTGDGAIVSGFTLENGSYSAHIVNHADVGMFSNNTLIEGNVMRNSDIGVFAQGNKSRIERNIITNNELGIFITGNQNMIINNSISNNTEYGIIIWGYENIIKGNSLRYTNNTAIYIIGAHSNAITRNEISFNSFGIKLAYVNDGSSNQRNIISKNNIRNNIDGNAVFGEGLVSIRRNIWYNNYWGRAHILPKAIIGLKTIIPYPTPYGILWFPTIWFHFDWHPALKPFDIPLQT
jgi:parallel beta-helix repeat protein